MKSPKASKKSKHDAATLNHKVDVQVKIPANTGRNLRETIESVAIAFILAFLFRTFEAEAFVIPTGSMAPTLQGQHKDIDCIKCGMRFQVNASHEEGGVDSDVVAATCPQCRYTLTLDSLGKKIPGRNIEEIVFGAAQGTYPGDRILVGKFVYDFTEPQRWDVVVFKFPGDTKMNYIKRLVGLPGEEIHIRYGDIYTRPIGEQGKLEIERKPPDKQLAMMQMVHDTNYTCSELVQKEWPMRWQALPKEVGNQAASGWQQVELTPAQLAEQNVQPVYTVAAGSTSDRWLRDQHFVPGWKDWEAMTRGPLGNNYQPAPQLITDFYAYNTNLSRRDRGNGTLEPDTSKLGLHWVGDLMVQADVEVQNNQGELLLELVEGGIHFRCRIDVATGLAKLDSSAADLKDFHPQAQTLLRGPGKYNLRFANVDKQLRLWIDGELIEFDAETTFDLNILRPQSTPLEPGDLAPAGIGSKGAALKVTALQLYRDIYYIATTEDENAYNRPLNDYPYDALPRLEDFSPEDYAKFLSTSSQWQIYTKRRTVSFTLAENAANPERDQFLMLGDNSPFSKDSRLWPIEDLGLKFYVERQLLIGKALCIYWPHTWHRIPGTSIPFPYFPNFGDMGLVR